MPLVKALVRVEMTSLEDQDECHSSAASKPNRRVHFSGFDCSSTKPPVDAKVGSHNHQQDCISALIFATQQMKALSEPAQANSENYHRLPIIARALKAAIAFLKQLSLSNQVLGECAKV
jgi:hypothetical protein